jgi:hypothetical protein
MSIRALAVLLTVVLGLCAASCAQSSRSGESRAQKTGGKIEIKTDRFSGKTNITLAPLALLDDSSRLLTLALEAEWDKVTASAEKLRLKNEEDMRRLGISPRSEDKESAELPRGAIDSFYRVSLKCELQAAEAFDFGDGELHFLVDSKPIKIGKAFVIQLPNGLHKAPALTASLDKGVPLDVVRRIAEGNRVEMRLGAIELTISQPTLSKLREFSNQALALRKSAMEEKS